MKNKSVLSASLSADHVAPTQETVSFGYGVLVFVMVLIGLLALSVFLGGHMLGYYSAAEAWDLTRCSVWQLLTLKPLQSADWLIWYHNQQDNIRSELDWFFGGTLGLSLLAALVVAIKATLATKGDDQIHLSGPKLLHGYKGIEYIKKRLKPEYKAFAKGVNIHPALPLSSQREKQGCLVVGQVGSGKTQILLGMIDQAISAKQKSVVFDIKGDFTSYYAGLNHVAILAPWDRRSIKWSIAKDINTEFDAERFAETLIVSNQNDPMWAISARLILVGCMLVLIHEHGDQWGWKSLSNLLNQEPERLQSLLKKYHPQSAQLVDPKSKTSQSMLLTLYAQVKPIHQLAKAWGDALDGVSLVAWATSDSTNQSTLILQSHTDYSDLSQSLADLALMFISQTLLGLPDDHNRSLYFFLDEAAHIKFSNLPKLLSLGRSKGAKLFVGVQDLNLLKRHFTQEEITSISSMLGTLVVLRVSEIGETASFLSKALGSKQVERLAKTFDYKGGDSYTWQSQTLPVVTESGISQLPQASKKGVTGYLSIAGTEVVAKLLWPLHKVKPTTDAVIWADWTKAINPRRSQKLTRAETALSDAFAEVDNA